MSEAISEVSTGSMGSTFYRIHCPVEEIERLARMDWNQVGRRVFIDPVQGLISWMAPSITHEIYAEATKEVVRGLARAAKRNVAELGSTRWRGSGDPANTGCEPDACFYIGDRADAYFSARRSGLREGTTFAETHPPDLVVEVERSHGDGNKPGFYRRLGVPEMWRLDVGLGQALALDMLDLRSEPPQALETSHVLQGAGSVLVAEALELANTGRLRRLQRLLAAYGRTVLVPPVNH